MISLSQSLRRSKLYNIIYGLSWDIGDEWCFQLKQTRVRSWAHVWCTRPHHLTTSMLLILTLHLIGKPTPWENARTRGFNLQPIMHFFEIPWNRDLSLPLNNIKRWYRKKTQKKKTTSTRSKGLYGQFTRKVN